MTEEEIRAELRARNNAILNCPEAKGATNLAQHLAYETEMSIEDAVGALKAFQVDLANIGAKGSTNRDAAYEERKRAAGALGLADLDSSAEVSQRTWDQAIANAHKLHGIEDPEVGATGRKLQ